MFSGRHSAHAQPPAPRSCVSLLATLRGHADRRGVRFRRRRGHRAQASAGSVQGAGPQRACGARGAELRPVSRHTFSARPRVVAQRRRAVRGDVLPRGQGERARTDGRGRRRQSAPHPVLERRLQLRQEHAVAGEMGRSRFRRLPRALPAERAAYKDEVVVFLGASYFRALGAGARYGLSARGLAVDTAGGNGRGVPALHRVLAGEARGGRAFADAVRAARLAARDRRVSIRRASRATETVDGRPLAAIPARLGCDARHRPVHEHVFSTARTSRIERTSAPRSTTPMARWSRQAAASGSGVR